MKILFDTDPGIDDAMALWWLARDPRVDLVGITTVFGNASIEVTTANAWRLRERFGLSHVPIARGASQALQPNDWGPASMVHGHDGLGDVGLAPAKDTRLASMDAAQFIVAMARRHPGELCLLPVGPLTNIARALRLEPELPRLIQRVVVMGGALGRHGHGGNMSPVAEANILADPHAADAVMTAAWPLTMVGLDVTHQVLMSTDYLNELGNHAGEHGRFMRDITRVYEAFYQPRTGGGIFCHDASAVACALDADCFEYQRGAIRVVTEGLAIGQTIQAPSGLSFPATDWLGHPEQSVCIGVDAPRLLADFRQTFAGASFQIA